MVAHPFPRIQPSCLPATGTFYTLLLLAQVKLAGDGSQAAARLVKARLERTQLGQVCKHIKAVLQPGHAHVAVRLDMRHISKLSLDVTAMHVKSRILEHSKLKLKDVNAVRCGLSEAGSRVLVRPRLPQEAICLSLNEQSLSCPFAWCLVWDEPVVDGAHHETL